MTRLYHGSDALLYQWQFISFRIFGRNVCNCVCFSINRQKMTKDAPELL